MGFFKFIVSREGRITRVVVGLILFVVGYLVGSTLGIVIAAIGVLPFATGLLDVCVLGVPIGLPFSGRKVREHFSQR